MGTERSCPPLRWRGAVLSPCTLPAQARLLQPLPPALPRPTAPPSSCFPPPCRRPPLPSAGWLALSSSPESRPPWSAWLRSTCAFPPPHRAEPRGSVLASEAWEACPRSSLSRRNKNALRWDRPSPFVVCHPSQKDGWLTDDKKRSSVPPGVCLSE